MKKLFLIISILFLMQPAYGLGIYKEIDFEKDSEINASKILYEYCLKNENMTPEQIKDVAGIVPQSVQAVEIDLNNDGMNEIVGFVYSTFYMGKAGYCLFILQKQKNEYKNISFINFEPIKHLFILKNKTNSYMDIKLYGSVAYNFQPFIVKFQDGGYVCLKQLKDFEQALRQ